MIDAHITSNMYICMYYITIRHICMLAICTNLVSSIAKAGDNCTQWTFDMVMLIINYAL